MSIALRGAAWSTLGYGGTQGLRVVATLVLARHFLGPEPFGVVGLVGVFLAGLAMFSELGLVANVVQHARGDEPRFLNTAFTIQAVRGVLIWVVAAGAAYPLAVFYKQPALFALLMVAAISEVIRGLVSTGIFTFTRHVNLRALTLLTIASEAVGVVVAIVWAYASPSAWALVARTVAAAIVYAAGSHLIAKLRVRFEWDRAAARDILHFGGWISLATATYFLGGQGERLILGKFITAAELGCFSLALMVSSVPAAGINQLVGQIFLPVLSKSVRTNQSTTRRDFLRARKLFCGVALITAVGFLICGKPFVNLVLPEKYEMAGWMLQLLGLRVALDIFAAPASTLVMAYGKTQYSASANTLRLILMVAGIWLAFGYLGLGPAIIALVVAQAVSYIPLIAGIRRLLPEAGGAELRWYVGFLAVVLAVALIAVP
jgi:O-antigen/teichoic acid export membrane protein